MNANANKNASPQTESMLAREALRRDFRQQVWRFFAALIATALVFRAFKHVSEFFGLHVSSDASPARFLMSTSIGIIAFIAFIFLCWILIFAIGRKHLRCPLCGASILNPSSTLFHGRCETCGKTICENSLPAEPAITKLLPMNHAEFRREMKRWARRNCIITAAASAMLFAILIAGTVWNRPLAAALHVGEPAAFAIAACLGLVAFFIGILLGCGCFSLEISCPHCGKAVCGAPDWMRVFLLSACPHCNTRILPDEPQPQAADSSIQTSRVEFMRRSRRAALASTIAFISMLVGLALGVAALCWLLLISQNRGLAARIGVFLIILMETGSVLLGIKMRHRCPNCKRPIEKPDLVFATRRCAHCGVEIIREVDKHR